MLKKILLDKNVLPFNMKVNFDNFQKRYIQAKKYKKNTDMSFVYNALLPDFNRWATLFKTKNYYNDITVYTCLRFLQSDDKTPGTLNNKIYLLEKYLNFFNLNYLNIIEEAYLLHINKDCYIPYNKYIKPKDLFFYIAKEIKMFIFSLFRKAINYQNKQDSILQKSINNLNYHIDFFYDKSILSNIPLDMYRSLLHSILTQKMYKTNNFTQQQQERYLCQLIKILPYSN